MLTIEKINTDNKVQVKRFVDLSYRLYKDCPQWVPPLLVDANLPLNRKKHPFFEHSEADFFLAIREGEVVGRICAADNKLFNDYHKTKKAHFYAFEAVNDLEVARALFEAVTDWSKQRGLDTVIGPKGLSPFDGYGILVEGFGERQMMTMMNYNYDYYPKLIEALGFEKEVDFVSCYLPAGAFKIPERVERIAERVIQRGDLWVKKFKTKRELVQWAPRIGYAYNKAFIHNWEYYPFTEGDVKYAVDNVFLVADHVDDNGAVHCTERRQSGDELQAIRDDNLRMQNGEKQVGNYRMTSQIPLIFIEKWLNEEWMRGNVGLKLCDEEFDKIIFRKLQDPDWKFLRTT